MAPCQTKEQLRKRLKSPWTLECRATLFNVQAFRRAFVSAMVQAEARGSGRFRESRAHSWEGCAKLPRDTPLSKDGCIFLHNAVKDSACPERFPGPMLDAMRPALVRLILLGTLLLCAGCSGFDRRWNAAKSASPHPDSFAGAYQGTWESSQYKGASGKLWCILTRRAPDLYHAEFRATWHGIFSSRHAVDLRVTDRKGRANYASAKISGAAEIRMWIGAGRYRCEGEVTTTGLTADYDAKLDRGRFSLVRVGPTARP